MPSDLSQRITFAAGAGQLDRAAHLRDGSEALLSDERAAILPLRHDKPLTDLAHGEPRLGWMTAEGLGLPDLPLETVFLGVFGGRMCFAADLAPLADDEVEDLVPEAAKFIDLRSTAGQLSPGAASVGATAKALLGWHRSHAFCARCGGSTRSDQGGWRRRCDDCGALHFPRTDPVVIMLVLKDDHVLVGRQEGWPAGMYSLLAGFMEPGETIADAVRREVMEETSVRCGPVRFLSDQPWPFPSSLMIGCSAEAESEEIDIDPTELEDAIWISRAKMKVILDGKHPRFAAPRVDAVARSLIEAWVAGDDVEP